MVVGTVFIASMRYGAVAVSWQEIATAISKSLGKPSSAMTLHESIFLQIRFPRACLCLLAGASLAVAGVLLQALFRNPLVEPGLIGTSSGSAFGAGLYLVLGASFQIHAGEWTLPIAACLGGILATLLVVFLANSAETGKTSITALLLTGIAINSLFMSGVGFLSYIARDPQARSITFWNLGTLSGANWEAVVALSVVFFLCMLLALRHAKELNTLMLGEEEAAYLGTNIAQLKRNVILLNVLLVGVTTAFVGVIGFVGLIAPHMIRLVSGSDNRHLIYGSALCGAILLTMADLTARLLLKPAELPIGIVTSMVGVPIFILLLKKGKSYFF